MSEKSSSISDCSFVNCSASNYGGAIDAYDSDDSSVNGCIFALCTASKGNAIWTNSNLDFNGNFFTTNNTISAKEFIDNKFVYENDNYVAPEMFVVLNIKLTNDGYVLIFVENGTNNAVVMPDYDVSVTVNGVSSIVPVGEDQTLSTLDDVNITAYSLDGKL